MASGHVIDELLVAQLTLQESINAEFLENTMQVFSSFPISSKQQLRKFPISSKNVK